MISALPVLLQEQDRLQSSFSGNGQSEIPVIVDPRIQEINFGVLEGSRFKDENGTILSEEMKIFFTDPKNFIRPERGKIFQIF